MDEDSEGGYLSRWSAGKLQKRVFRAQNGMALLAGDRDDCPPKYSHDELWEIRKRREALRACVKAPSIGTIFPWKGPSFFNADSLVATILEADLNVPALPQAASAVDQHRPDKRMPLPILCKTVAGDGTVSCGPLPEQTLRLDELLGQGYDSPSFVYRCTVEPGNYVVVVKLLTDQNDKVPANTHIPQEVYSNQVDWQLPGLGVTAQQDICNEADRFKDLQSLQGTYVPYSYGFYEVRGELLAKFAGRVFLLLR